MSAWTFPHSTCEISWPAQFIQQPFSFGMNLVNAGLLSKDAAFTSDGEVRMALISFVLFEIIHAVSHAVHLNRHIHETSVHFCGYLMALTTFAVFQKSTKMALQPVHTAALAGMIIVDLVTFSTIRGLYSIATGLSVLAVAVGIHIPVLPKSQQILMLQLVGGTVVLFAMFGVEFLSCKYFLTKAFNYHPWVIESWGILLFQMLSRLLRIEGSRTGSNISTSKNQKLF